MNELDTSIPPLSSANSTELATPKDRAIIYWLGLPILALDLLTKWWIIRTIPLNQQHVPIAALFPYYKHTHVANIGAVFGTLQGTSSLIFLSILAVVVIIGLNIYNFRLTTASRKLRVALGLVLGGASGNLIDRLINGHVTDFIDFDFSSIIPIRIADWYIFNIADLAIVSAVVLMAYLTFFEPEQIEGNKRQRVIDEEADVEESEAVAFELLEQEEPVTINEIPSIASDFQTAAEVASINEEATTDEALDMLDLSDKPETATDLLDLKDEG